MKHVKSLYIWWLTVLASATAVFWAYHNGILMKIWHDDVTMITSILGLMYIAAIGTIGYIAYTIHKRNNSKLIDAVWFGSEQMLALGWYCSWVHLSSSIRYHFSVSHRRDWSGKVTRKYVRWSWYCSLHKCCWHSVESHHQDITLCGDL